LRFQKKTQMLIQCFVDFDNTIFPSNELMRYFHNGTCRFENVPDELRQILLAIDHRVTSFIVHNMFSMRIRIITHAGPYWVRAALRLMPYLQRFVDWGYVGLITCGNDTKYTKFYQIIAQEPVPDMFFCCGDAPHDVEAVPQVIDVMLRSKSGDIDRLQVCKVTTCKFIENPSCENILYEWENIQGRFPDWVNDPRKRAYESFQVKENAKRFILPDMKQEHYVSPSASFEMKKGRLPVIQESIKDETVIESSDDEEDVSLSFVPLKIHENQ